MKPKTYLELYMTKVSLEFLRKEKILSANGYKELYRTYKAIKVTESKRRNAMQDIILGSNYSKHVA